jgi:Icc-related predicted phosphoesterase
LAAAEAYSADVLILGGDIAGKGLVPIQAKDGRLTATLHGDALAVPMADEARLRSDINRLGFYSVVLGDAELDMLENDSTLVTEIFQQQITEQLEGWFRLAAERLQPTIRCIVTPGNDDPYFIDGVLKAAPRIESPEAQLCEIGPIVLASLGDVTPTPWKTDREYSEEQLAARIGLLLDPLPAKSSLVLNFHCPPFDSGLDSAAELDGNLRPVIRSGQPSMVPVGSKAVRDAIAKYRPVVGLHGHIHEARGAQRIGRSLCLNPGSDYTSDLLRGALVDFGLDGNCIDFLLTAG